MYLQWYWNFSVSYSWLFADVDDRTDYSDYAGPLHYRALQLYVEHGPFDHVYFGLSTICGNHLESKKLEKKHDIVFGIGICH